MTMRCEDAREQLVDLVYDELPPEATMALRDHTDTCPACARELRALEATLGAIGAWGQLPIGQPFRPAPALQTMMTAGPGRHFWSRFTAAFRSWDFCPSAICGMIFAALTFFLLKDYIAAAELPATTHVFLGVLSGGLCAGLFHIALRGGQRPMGLRLQPTAWAVLIAAFLTCLLLYLIPLPVLLMRPPLAGLSETGPWGAGKEMAYFLMGVAYAAIPFVVAGMVASRRIRERLVPHAVAGACMYLLVVAPGLAIVCAPFNFGVYLSMLGGSGLGGLGGALAGLGLMASF